jgi:2-amino-4-hydroxy-6-hydroxymethyldihydropteridine diphosphokinase
MNNIIEICYIGVGTNLGDRLNNIRKARDLLSSEVDIRYYLSSGVYENEAVDLGEAPDFYNSVFKIETSIKPQEILSKFKEIERKMGRDTSKSNCSRIIDLDILTYGNLIYKTPELCIPHPRMHERLFVVAPLFEIDEGFIHPLTGAKIRDLLKVLRGSMRIKLLASRV